ncbi:alcohol dehydrogenase family protein [Vibrio breoganii]|uniref:Zinc-binding dehydrogenase n=1 Tax=Vibrio breoganii TaxID=553239 RepID=A0ABX1U2H5_9VIBR|nr:alcohol dehydrogenase family protein [Vibrio breoganii]NMO72054.1 zinc-binding dehydrogenase [Vibrio breoganii]NMR68669.1 zinc-binding dehydrogenase [Vibrio breoganii]PMF97036.1 alcohol dehydrogenase [Vibrio breoganii]PMH21529.1 alcohol dehydrogenase [Vibrio breoganii]PMK50586.1 alcohol dehydrogenase [Vibrio breoganii]
MNTQTMYGVQMIGHGDFDQLQYKTDIEVPTPSKGEVLIKVSAAGVNNTDINTRIGWYAKGDVDGDDTSWSGDAFRFPRIQGADVCGVIVAVGAGIDSTRIGERVIVEPCLNEANGEALPSPWYFGSECDGGFAEFTKVASRYAHHVNTQLSDVELASFPCSYSTAENMLTRANVGPSDTVLVTGATGGVGSAAIQLAKARGAKVIGVTSRSKEELLKSIGTDEVVFRDEDLVSILGVNSVDVVIDLVGGNSWPTLLDVMKPKGRYAVSGAIAGADVTLDLRTLYLKDLSFFGCTVIEPEVFPNLVKRIESGQIKPLVAMTFPLQQIEQAQLAFMDKKHLGKIVLTLD